MGEEGSPSSMGSLERDRELLIPVSMELHGSTNASSSSSHHHSGREAFYKVIRSWTSKKFMTGCVILFPIAMTFYITWWFYHFVDGFFSPVYAQLGINIFGMGFFFPIFILWFIMKLCTCSSFTDTASRIHHVYAFNYWQCPLHFGNSPDVKARLGFATSITFIFLVGVFMSSWLGASVLGLGEWFIKRMPFVRHIYNASKQISSAVSPDQNKQAFKEVVIIRHPRLGEYAFGFITSAVSLQHTYSVEEELYCVYVPTNHLYVGDIFLVSSKDIIRPNLSVREGIEIVVSTGMSMPQILTTLDPHMVPVDRTKI
ncbi:hypothetical protein ZIOFF_002194 [Zingiber officinale]|uniref:Uncharacterized protein n=1 Tax=Zingiber officinale TaxID=94328 RepID=A0A8J5HWI8_ZINOF|nr:hypothetical protein ZIOFF_047747 [Zingiber officinale]KAG6537112.1 hypothetical protein ZIOFF_002194 [Zingiber officinale]